MATHDGSDPTISDRLNTVLESFIPGLSTMEDPILPGPRDNRGRQRAEEVIINMDNEPQQSERNSSATAGASNTNPQQDEEAVGGGLFDMRIIHTMSDSKLIIFALILLAKVLNDHGLGLLVFVGLTGTFGHHNVTLKRQVSLKHHRRAPMLALMLIMLFFSSFFVYYVFEDQELYKCLIFQQPKFQTFDLWTVLWCTGITDYILKYITISIKCVIGLLPHAAISVKRKGRAFLTVEQASQLFRILPPIPLWVTYFNQDVEETYIAAYIFTIAYVLSKAYVFYVRFTSMVVAIKQLLSEVQYGVAATKDQIGDSCPICQDDYTNPIQLNCKHVFCEDCVGLWFDRERTCPMCRAKIADNPAWRDGSTSLFIQFF
ncbi:putative RING finger and transmembrane domain-containing protein 1 [Apostichopus japonicus]|uniref:Putative RING finger and transmembrane domain-containing protein 1 n=1 Tax=Stichopus japonicus TaxID=307972 RepID=A0A2G8L9K5_STIJA|nr:putative RING finger and transmembrane domain-containing protein 1 [Apostichopus japonicus]